MRRFRDSDVVDYCIVGVGAAGAVLAQRLARAGFDVVGLEAGPFWDSERDWVSDETGSHPLYWTEPRVTGGEHALALGENNSGRGVGGGTVHWAAFTPRLHPSDFEIHTRDGVGADWPMPYAELKPYYALMEKELPVSGPAWFPWGDPHGYPYGPHPLGANGHNLVRGCNKLGIRVCTGGPVGINAGSRGDRPHCIYRGFCIQGCKVGAKFSTLVGHVPDALTYGADIREKCMVGRVLMHRNGRAEGVLYYDPEGRERRQQARAVIVCGYSIETPRLLFNSACPGFEHGLANSSGVLGRYLMAQAGNVVLARFDQLQRQYKAPPAHALTEHFYETDPKRDFARGFAVQTVGPLPAAMATNFAVSKGAWGWGMRALMMDSNHWSALALLGEVLPWADNRVELAEETDGLKLPVAKVTFGLKENDQRLIAYGVQTVTNIFAAAGATEIVQEPRFAHLVGAARMGNDPDSSVVNKYGRAHDVPNLFICDGSIMPTQGSANPGLTIMALAARTADYLIREGDAVFSGGKLSMEPPPVRYDLSPPDTWGHGVPRIKS